jgi:hypothetical protein
MKHELCQDLMCRTTIERCFDYEDEAASFQVCREILQASFKYHQNSEQMKNILMSILPNIMKEGYEVTEMETIFFDSLISTEKLSFCSHLGSANLPKTSPE